MFRVASDQRPNEASLSCFTAEGCLGEGAVLCSAGAGHYFGLNLKQIFKLLVYIKEKF